MNQEDRIRNALRSILQKQSMEALHSSFDLNNPSTSTTANPYQESTFGLEDLKKAIESIPPLPDKWSTFDELWCGDFEYFKLKTGATLLNAVGVTFLLGKPVIQKGFIPRNIVFGIFYRKSLLLEDQHLPGIPEITFMINLDRDEIYQVKPNPFIPDTGVRFDPNSV